MTFLSPWLLGLLPLLLGILWLLHRRRPAALLAVGNLFLWRETQERTETAVDRPPRHRVWLFVLDAAIVLALGLALARPLWLHPRGRSLGIVVDVSMSMGAREDGGTRLDRAREAAASLVRDLEDGDSVVVVEASSRPRVA
ncbi:MAG TPA: BatA domain-containing protein, partial [Vicinamibacteria bacterium]